MPVIGTAGHVDHGKSTLVRALTGRDPDRWAEEKTRGLTIDLGFAWATISGHEVSFVDVPGHEQFIKNMLAGIESIDVALMVVAADEGWMPQSEEHLAVLDLLETQRGVVALTKVDRVDDELAELAQLEITERLEGTSLEAAPIIPVSSTTGSGIAALESELAQQLAAVPTDEGERPRMWVDRVFSITGAGTVVTGTLLGGTLTVGDQVAVWPGNHPGRVRSIQSHEQERPSIGPRRRVALNLAGLERHQIERGAMLGLPGQWTTSARMSALVRPARYVDEITDRGAYHLHIGSGAWPVRLRMLDDDHAVITLPAALPLAMGDRFILRETGRRLVVGGGRVLDPDPPERGRDVRARFERLMDAVGGSPDDRATALLETRGEASKETLTNQSGGGWPRGALEVGASLVTAQRLQALADATLQAVDRFHTENALRPGMPTASLATRLGVPVEMIEAAIGPAGQVVIDGALIRRGDFVVDRADRDEEWASARTLLEESRLAVPRVAELGIDRELLHALIRDRELVRVSEEFVYLPSQVEEIVARFEGMADGFTVSDFKDRTGLSRKYAVPFLEWADRTGLTVRMGDTRRFR